MGAVRDRRVDGGIEDQSELPNLEVRVVEQLHRRGAEHLSIDANGITRGQPPDRGSPVATDEDERGGRQLRQYRQEHAALTAAAKQVGAEAKLAVLTVV